MAEDVKSPSWVNTLLQVLQVVVPIAVQVLPTLIPLMVSAPEEATGKPTPPPEGATITNGTASVPASGLIEPTAGRITKARAKKTKLT